MAGLEPAELTGTAGGLNWRYLEWNKNGRINILLAHGITSDARAWWRLGADLARQGAHVVGVDMPGHGETSSGPDTRWDTTARQLADFAKLLGWDAAGYRLAGHSWGGVTGLRLAARYNTGLARVALLDPALDLRPDLVETFSPAYIAQVGQPKLDWQAYYDQSKVNNSRWPEHYDHFWKAGAMLKFQPEVVRDFWLQNAGDNAVIQLLEVKVPLLLLMCDEQEGGFLSAQTQAACRSALEPASGQAVRLDGIGHNLLRENYAVTTAHLSPFLLAGL